MLFDKSSKKEYRIPDEIKKMLDNYITYNASGGKGIFNLTDEQLTRIRKIQKEESVSAGTIQRVPISKIEKSISENGISFHDKLFELIDDLGMEDKNVWKNAGIDRKLFSKIKSNPGCRPKKKTVMSLCIGLRLDVEQTKDLMSRAGLAFNPGSRFDLIVGWAIENKQYDILELNNILYEYTGDTLSM